MRDGDEIELLPTLERAQKYDFKFSNQLVSCMTDFLAELAFSCLM